MKKIGSVNKEELKPPAKSKDKRDFNNSMIKKQQDSEATTNRNKANKFFSRQPSIKVCFLLIMLMFLEKAKEESISR